MTSTESTATDTTELSAISANSADSDAAADAIALDFKLARLVAAWKVDASTVDISDRVTASIQLNSASGSAAPPVTVQREQPHQGLFDPELRNTQMLSPEEEKALAIKIEQGDKSAREALVLRNLRLVESIAKKYQNRGVAMEDLIQEGTFGLIHAVEKFDYRRGFRFATYATHWIRQALGRAVENPGQTVRLPKHAIEALAKIKSTRDLLTTKLSRTPTVNEIALEVGLTVERVELFLQADAPDPMNGDALGDLLPAKDAQPFERIPVGSSAHALARILYVSQSASPVPTDSLLKQKYWLGVSDTERFQKARHGTFPYIDLVTHPPSVDVQIVISPELANRYGIVPVRKQGNRLWVACLAPDDVHAIDAVRMYTKCLVQPMIADPGAIADALVKYYGSPDPALVPPPPPSRPPVAVAAGTPEPYEDTATLLRSAISELRGLREEVLTLRSEVAALRQERSATVPRPSTARLFPFAPPESASRHDR